MVITVDMMIMIMITFAARTVRCWTTARVVSPAAAALREQARELPKRDGGSTRDRRAPQVGRGGHRHPGGKPLNPPLGPGPRARPAHGQRRATR